jgi:MFS family permease
VKRPELPLLFALFLDLVGFGITFPDVQLRAQDYGAPGWLVGVVLSSYYLVQMAASPWWGRLSDRIGRKPVLLLCGALSAASMVLYALARPAHGVLWLLSSRLLAGVGAANVVVAQAYIADTAAPEARPAALGRMSAAVSAGLVLGPVIGGLLARAGGNLLLGLVAAAASALGAVWILIAVPPRPPVERAGGETTGNGARAAFSLFRGNPALARLFVVAVTGWFALACLEGTYGRLIHHNLGMGQLEFGLLLSLEAGVALVQGLLYPLFARRLSAETLLRLSYGLQAVGLALMPFAPGLGALAAASTLFGLGVGAANPAINGGASELVPTDRQGEVFGLLQSSRAMGFLVGPILGGILFDWRPEAPYLAVGLVLALAALPVPRLFERP